MNEVREQLQLEKYYGGMSWRGLSDRRNKTFLLYSWIEGWELFDLAGGLIRIKRYDVPEELRQLEEEEREAYKKELGLEYGLETLIQKSYKILDLITFYTSNENELRAWTVKSGTSAVQSAGLVHSDMEKGFIKAEVINSNDLISAGSMDGVHKTGKLRIEGRDYKVLDGDLMLFKFNV